MAVIEDSSEEIIDPNEGVPVNSGQIPTLEVEQTENFHRVLYNQELPSHKIEGNLNQSLENKKKYSWKNTPSFQILLDRLIMLNMKST